MKIAVDRDILRRFLQAETPDSDAGNIRRLLESAESVYVLPLIAEEIEADGDPVERRWAGAGFQAIAADEFFAGCAAGMAQRYVDYYADPRGCRLVAEAECARADALVTLDDELIRGLRGRVERIQILTPLEALRRITGAAPDA